MGGEIHHKHQKKEGGEEKNSFCFYEEFLPGRKKFPRFSRSSSYLSPPPLVTFPLFYFPSSSSSSPSFPLPVVSRLRLRRQTDPSPLFFSFSLSHPSVDPIMPPSPLSLSPSSFITQPGGGREDFAVEVKQEGFVGWSLKAPAPLGGCCTCSPPFYSLARSLFLQRLGFLHG